MTAVEKSKPHFRQRVFPRFASVPQTGQRRRLGFVMNQMIERMMKPMNQMQKSNAKPAAEPIAYPDSHASRYVSSAQVSLESDVAAAAISQTPIRIVKPTTTQDIFRQRKGFTGRRSFVLKLMVPLAPQMIAQSAA